MTDFIFELIFPENGNGRNNVFVFIERPDISPLNIQNGVVLESKTICNLITVFINHLTYRVNQVGT